MCITKYQIFVRTAICGSFTKAAEQLGFTQSGVSHAIASLEDELGLQLMARGRGGVSLTAGRPSVTTSGETSQSSGQ